MLQTSFFNDLVILQKEMVDICEFIKTKAEEEAMELMTPKSAEEKAEEDVA